MYTEAQIEQLAELTGQQAKERAQLKARHLNEIEALGQTHEQQQRALEREIAKANAPAPAAGGSTGLELVSGSTGLEAAGGRRRARRPGG